MSEAKEKETSVISKFFTVLGTILCVILTPILILNCTLIAKSYLNKNAVPDVGGYSPMIVLSDSMFPYIEAGDLIICKQTDPETVKVGDVISFFDPASNTNSVVTHRVVEIQTAEDGTLTWITRGDANNADDSNPVPANNLVGVYKHKFSGLGNVAIYMQTTKGLITCVVVPIILLLGFDFVRQGIYERRRKKDTDALLAELETLRAEKEKNKAQNDQSEDRKAEK